jgi:hypothetical protein
MTKMEEHLEYHKDGSLWAKGQKKDGKPIGYWEWFRREGTKSPSGYFEEGEPIGKWITYDREGKIYKVTNKKRKPS